MQKVQRTIEKLAPVMARTGTYAVDVNSPEDIEKTYGKYPVVRLVQGISGNANLVVPNRRHGLLIHSGEWPK